MYEHFVTPGEAQAFIDQANAERFVEPARNFRPFRSVSHLQSAVEWIAHSDHTQDMSYVFGVARRLDENHPMYGNRPPAARFSSGRASYQTGRRAGQEAVRNGEAESEFLGTLEEMGVKWGDDSRPVFIFAGTDDGSDLLHAGNAYGYHQWDAEQHMRNQQIIDRELGS